VGVFHNNNRRRKIGSKLHAGTLQRGVKTWSDWVTKKKKEKSLLKG
jgi:hypothetical protein